MDIRTKAVALVGYLHLRDASDELMFTPDGNAVAVNLHSPGSKQYAKAAAAQQNRMMDVLKRKGKVEQSAEQKRAENAEFLADCTTSFDNLTYGDLVGRELAITVYSDTSIGFISDQVSKFIGDWSNFSNPSATN